MNRILEWDSESGQLTCEPGVTLEQAWKRVEPEGWWPPVVSGTMKTTLGGCLAANIHGKNNFQRGPIGEHVTAFTALLADGTEVKCAPDDQPDLFFAMIGGFGLLGIFTSITLQMKPVASGLLTVDAWPSKDLGEHVHDLLENAPHFDYIVGWLDTMAGGRGLGRGQIHAARYLAKEQDPNPELSRRLDRQVLPDRLFGVFPKALLHHFMRPFVNNFAWRVVNQAKYVSALRRHTFRQSHAAFHFLLDYVPNWELTYGRGGLIQYQSFLPKESAIDAWTAMLKLSHRHGLPSYLGVTKRHRADKFLLSHALDGLSLAMDFKVTNSNRPQLARLLEEFDHIVLDAGGRFYFAKNSETSAETAKRFLGAEALEQFRRLKRRCDPQGLLESDLYRRVFGW
jgi:FAD/FMN-containing dehydrogenase